MISDRTRDLLLPLTILASVAVGAVIGGTFGRAGSDSRAPSTGTSADPKALVDAIDSLHTELVRIRERLDASSMSAVSPVQADTRSPAQQAVPDLRLVTAQLTEAAEALRSAASRTLGDRTTALIAPPTRDQQTLKEMSIQEFNVVSKPYLLWTYQQVMDRFGSPDSVSARQEGMIWQYKVDDREVSFHFADGRLCYVTN
jgi:hypothetical protein